MRPLLLCERAVALRFLGLPEPVLRRIGGPPIRSPEGFVLDVQSQALLWLMRVRRVPRMHDENLRRARRRFERAGALLAPTHTEPLDVSDRRLPGGAGPRPCRVYTPVAAKGRRIPALVWFHGGGFVLGSMTSHDGTCRALASQAGVAVISVDYRLAPEHRFPAGLEDAVAATRWILESGEALGIDSRRVAVGGDSAGGNLAAGAVQALRAARHRPSFQLLAYPATDATRREPSHRHFRSGFLLAEDNITWFLHHYLPAPALADDPRVSPVLARDVSALPPALVMTAGFDPLRDEGMLYARRMRDAGVDVETICSEGSMHGFLSTAGGLGESARLLSLAADRLRRRLFGPEAGVGPAVDAGR